MQAHNGTHDGGAATQCMRWLVRVMGFHIKNDSYKALIY
jgi:hypothetical protein